MTKANRNRSAGRPGNCPESCLDGLLRSPGGLLRLIFHGLLCTTALILGVRLSREALFLMVSFKSPDGMFVPRTMAMLRRGESFGEASEVALRFPYVQEGRQRFTPSMPLPGQVQARTPPPPGRKSSRVHVGRHEILIRRWPHPDPFQTFVAHRLVDLVQHEQRRTYGLKERRMLLVITPTYVRTFQAVHLTCLIHTLRVVPSPLVWIVVEAGGVSNETSALLSSSELSFHHLGFQEAMPAVWEERRRLETLLRIEGLRFIRERRLDGIVLFVDDSNTYSLDFFEESQKVKRLGSFSVGILSHGGLLGAFNEGVEADNGVRVVGALESKRSNPFLPLQGPACNGSGHVVGWYAPTKDDIKSGIQGIRSTGSLEWAGFALNARLLWEEHDRLTGVRSWNELFEGSQISIKSPLDFLTNESLLEPLGNCGRNVLMWWLRVEARPDSKFPSRWVIDPSLEVIVPAKHTHWPDPPPRPPILQSSDMVNQREKHKIRQGSRGRGKRGPRNAERRKQGLNLRKVDMQKISQTLDDRTKE